MLDIGCTTIATMPLSRITDEILHVCVDYEEYIYWGCEVNS